ncbi:hypothetical protein ZIOFF_071918 [Zingiber officinale]|uniref:Eukaryotic translation initiation factor 3 subunit E N-terminal domain-containing protein n=1 Tax=Zingiber officinale TaxID=94328 RepID=A0A8J5EQV6_ZINOF|nr:hypothetical protein ZIOFF_071918 [Zingiber officinale]
MVDRCRLYASSLYSRSPSFCKSRSCTIIKAMIQLLSHTNMVDYAMNIHKALYHTEDVPQGPLCSRCLFSFFVLLALIRLRPFISTQNSNLSVVSTPALLIICTNFTPCALRALWGKLAAEILMQNWDVALQELNRLKEITDSKVILNDPFLSKRVGDSNFITVPLRAEFLENTRLFIFETIVLAEKLNLNMTYDESLAWITDLIRNSKLEAKIDVVMGAVNMPVVHQNNLPPSPHLPRHDKLSQVPLKLARVHSRPRLPYSSRRIEGAAPSPTRRDEAYLTLTEGGLTKESSTSEGVSRQKKGEGGLAKESSACEGVEVARRRAREDKNHENVAEGCNDRGRDEIGLEGLRQLREKEGVMMRITARRGESWRE